MESKGGDRGKETITGRVLLCAVGGAVDGAVGWSLLAVPQHLINVIFSVFVGAGAGVATGWWGGSTRSWRTVVIPLVVTAVLLLPIQGWITHQYLSWATDNLGGTPSDPSWDGPVGFIRLALDRAAGRKGWAPNASYFWWTMSLIVAAWLGWSTAPRSGASRRS